MAFASIWRTRFLVTRNSLPTSSSVLGYPVSMPKRSFIILASRSVSVSRILATSRLRSRSRAELDGGRPPLSSMKSSRWESSSSPIGVDSDIGSCIIFIAFFTLSMEICMYLAYSSICGSRPCSCRNLRVTFISLDTSSFMCTGMRIVRAWSAMARFIDCRTHHVA